MVSQNIYFAGFDRIQYRYCGQSKGNGSTTVLELKHPFWKIWPKSLCLYKGTLIFLHTFLIITHSVCIISQINNRRLMQIRIILPSYRRFDAHISTLVQTFFMNVHRFGNFITHSCRKQKNKAVTHLENVKKYIDLVIQSPKALFCCNRC